MLRFALNYNFAGSFADPALFKITNVVIRIINGWLAFWQMRIVFQRPIPALGATPRQW